jgi:S-adenosylmethionine:tRNA ribosyltransferase-isomerase
VLVSEFDFPLPEELIAQRPPEERSGARMLHFSQADGAVRDTVFREFPALLRPGDLLVMNNTRVLPARLYARRAGIKAQERSGEYLAGRIEVLLTKQVSDAPQTWEALVRPGRKIAVGERLCFIDAAGNLPADAPLVAEVVARGERGERTLRFEAAGRDFFAAIERLGHIPLPPYIARQDTEEDRRRYQTVYAQRPGSVAAPTAGLHFTPEILDAIRARGHEIAEITLHVGLGTFQPVRHEVVEENKLHTERYEIGADAAEKIARAKRDGRRVVAIGTTSVRTLEYAAMQSPDGSIAPQRGEAEIFIYPGFRFRVADALLTNFHLPKSTLMMLVAALAGRERILAAYHHAVAERYRFFSYGDCMFID